jgi:hypothetical protein
MPTRCGCRIGNFGAYHDPGKEKVSGTFFGHFHSEKVPDTFFFTPADALRHLIGCQVPSQPALPFGESLHL